MIKNINTSEQIQISHKQTGVTLIELMVAMAVSAVIILGISNIYLSTKKSYLIHDEFARVQENGRYSTEVLANDIRNAGFFGCVSGQSYDKITNTLNQSNTISWNFQTGIMGFDAVGTDVGNTKVITPKVISGNAADWTTAGGMTANGVPINAVVNPLVLNFATTGGAIAGSDILILRTTDALGVRITKDNNSNTLFVTNKGTISKACPQSVGPNTDSISGICKGDILLVSDCSKSRIFQATGVAPGGGAGVCGTAPCFNLSHSASGTPGNAPAYAAWNNQQGANGYGPDAEIVKIITKTYFIGISKTGAEPTLYVQKNNDKPEPLVEGVENMQILYGVDTSEDGAANRYYSANNVPDVDNKTDSVFDGVMSVKLSLLLRTPNAMPSINRTAADYAKLTYAMVSPAAPITIDPIANDATSTDRRMRKIYNLTIKIRNKNTAK